MKRTLALLMAAIMLFSLAACGGNDDGGSIVGDGNYEYTTGYDETKYNPPGELPIFKEKQTITLTIPDSKFVEDWDTNYQTRMLEEDLNADLVLTILPSKEYSTKINLMFASGGSELTDALIGSFADSKVVSLADTGLVAPLTEYYFNTDKSYYIHEGMERLGWNFFKQITMPDGEIYGVPRVNETPNAPSPDKFWIFGPWCEQLGIDPDKIETRDDLRAALKAFVTSDPNGNGKADEMGIVSYPSQKCWFNYLMNSFVYAGDKNYMLVEDGQLSFAFTRDEWRDGLKYMNSMLNEGLISPLSFSQDNTSFGSMLNAADTIVGAFGSAGPGGIKSDDERRVQYIGIRPLNSDYNDGKPLGSYTPTTADYKMIITTKASDIENTFRLGDYMCGLKNSLTTRFGQEGVDWVRPEEGDVALYAALGYEPYLRTILVWSTVQNSHWYQNGPYIRESKIGGGQVLASNNPLDHTRPTAEAQIKYTGTEPDEYITKLIYTEEENEIVSQYLSTILDYVDEVTAKAITGAIDIEKEWDKVQNQLSVMNIEDVLECAQAAFDRMK